MSSRCVSSNGPAISAFRLSASAGYSIPQDKSRASRDVKRLALDHIAEIRGKVAAMISMRDAVQALADACDGDERPECPILHDLEGAAVGHNR